MLHLVFHNLERSELAVQIATEHLEETLSRFPAALQSEVTVTLGREMSPTPTGPDLFRVRVRLTGGVYDSVNLDKTSPSLYFAIAAICEALLQRFEAIGDKASGNETLSLSSQKLSLEDRK